MKLLVCFFAAALSEVIVKLRSGGHVGLSTRGPSAFRVRFLFEDNARVDSPMIAPEEADAPFKKSIRPHGTGITTSFGSVLLSSTSRLLLLSAAGDVLTRSRPLKSSTPIVFSSKQGTLYGRGAGPDDALELTATDVKAWMRNTAVYVPYYYSTDGYAALGATNVTITEASVGGFFTLDTTAFLGVSYTSDMEHISWEYSGAFEIFLMPAATLDAGTQAYFSLCGSPRVPPRFTFGFLASRWGWKSRTDVTNTLNSFRAGRFPVDAYITDFEWFAPMPDYLFPFTGFDWYEDFGYSRRILPSPKHDLAHDLSAFHVRFGGIRKPRLGNSQALKMAWNNGWILPGGFRDCAAWRLFIFCVVLIGFVLAQVLFIMFLCEACWSRICGSRDPTAVCEETIQMQRFMDSAETGESDCETTRNAFAVSSASQRTRLRQFAQPCSFLCLCLWLLWLLLSLALLACGVFVLMCWQNRNLDFSQPEVRSWYASQLEQYVNDGVAFWWNDEGETNYYTYYWWNVAELTALRKRFEDARFYSINRGFSPGMARLGAAAWTGDISPTWEDLARTPGMMLNWGLAGAPYVACDIGGFKGPTEATLLVRWYQVGIFLPIMRVHSQILFLPHWPWLWGDAPALAMRKALDLRYRLVPYHYSLAHAMYQKGKLWMRPLVMDFPHDTRGKTITSEWMDGDLLVAPVLDANSQRKVYLPEGQWYEFNGTNRTGAILSGPLHIKGSAELDEVPVFVRAGGIVPVAPLVQFTDELPGGPLEIQIYAGAAGTFSLVEDDGSSTKYEAGEFRTTKLEWRDDDQTLSWTATGAYRGKHGFSHLFVTLFSRSGTKRSAIKAIGTSGAMNLGPADLA